MMQQQVEQLPEDEATFIEQQRAMIDPAKCDLTQYGLEGD
jgi:hypothetical protein